MVDKEEIRKVINNIVGTYKTHHNIKEIHKILNSMSDEEKYYWLKQKKLINPFEEEHYKICKKAYSNWKKIQEEDPNRESDGDYQKLQKKYLKEWGDLIFNYEKRIYTRYKPHTPKPVDVDISKYNEDTGFQNNHDESIHENEAYVIDKHNQLELTSLEKDGLRYYFGGNYEEVNGEIYNSKYWNGLSASEKEEHHRKNLEVMKGIDSALSRSKGLGKNMILYHGDKHFPINLVVGDTYKIKGYNSLSFSKGVGEYYGESGSDYVSMNIRYLVDKDYPCISANSNDLSYYPQEHEILTGKGTEARIVDIDYDEHLVTVLLE